MTDRETAAAIEALTHRLRNREPGTDAEVFALEFITALRARGWRPTEARVMPAWHRPAGHGVPPDADSPGVSAYREARLELEHQLIEAGAMDDEAISAHTRRGSEHNRILRGGGDAA
jgi:hypothetical protein